MDTINYDVWALRINDAIRAKQKKKKGGAETPRPIPVKAALLEFAAEAEAIVGAMGRNIKEIEISGGGRFTTLGGFLDEMLPFEAFSFLEYRYKLPSKKEPGLRFKVETLGDERRIAVHFFEDLIFWKVDENGRRVFHRPIAFDIQRGSIGAFPHPDLAHLFSGCNTWQLALRETLALPIRHLY